MRRWSGSIASICLGVALLNGCVSEPRVAVISDPGADIGAFETFAFHAALGTDREDGPRTLLSRALMNATQRELESLGYRLQEEGADLTINFFVETREVIRGRSGPSVAVGYGWYHRHYGVWTDYETDIRQHTESTLHVDVVDTAREQLVWEGISIERLKEHDLAFESENVASSVARIFADFPRRRVTAPLSP
jgi:hypothetical protein